MKKCWASCLGDCSEKMSGEHIVTAGMFSTEKVNVQGFPWCRDAPKEIGLASLVKNVLCEGHNSRLSLVDEAGIHTLNTLREFSRLGTARGGVPLRRWNIVRFDVGGGAFERWCLKTLITLSIDGPIPLGPQSIDSATPHDSLVRVCFGLDRLQAPPGLYVSYKAGDTITADEKVTIGTFNRDDKYIVGATFSLSGFQFILYVDDRDLQPGPLNFHRKDGTVEQRPQPKYHIKAFDFKIGKHSSHIVRFNWS